MIISVCQKVELRKPYNNKNIYLQNPTSGLWSIINAAF